MSLAVIAALPREIGPLMRRLAPKAHPEANLRDQGILLYRLPNLVVAAGGMGGGRASLTVGAVLKAQPDTETLLSVGLAGGCEPILRGGDVIEPRLVVDVNTGERFEGSVTTGPLMASADTIAGAAEKARLWSSYGAEAVDMESATVGRLARARGIGFGMIKGISDPFDFEMEELNRFVGSQGEFRTAAFGMYTAVRPGMWGRAMTLGRRSARALDAMTERVLAQIG